MTQHLNRLVTRRTFFAVLATFVVCGSANGQESEKGAFTDAIRLFAHEKSAAEQYGVILVTLGKNNIALYLQGIKLYADAKAEFDGLLADCVSIFRAGKSRGARPSSARP